jgi:3alpha(or 20beta)-hydroxysteroid dehydrogenase
MDVLDMFRLDGKVAIVTGASSGLGVAFAQALAQAGADVALGARRVDRLEETKAMVEALGRRAITVPTDVAKPEDCQRLVDETVAQLGSVDVLVNNAGVGMRPVRFDELDPAEYLRLFDVNVHGAYHGLRAMLPLLERSAAAAVVNISSIDGLVGVAGMAGYVASKHALTGLTRAVAAELGPLGIRVNSVHPGVVETPLVRSVGEARLARLGRIVARQPVPRMGTADEVARMVLFLASDDSAYCTGAQFTVDGGHVAGPWREPPV